MLSGKRWKAIVSRLLVSVLALAMVITMMPAVPGGYAYAESGSPEIKTPEVVVTGSNIIGGTAYSKENVGLERSYTRDELKALDGGTDIQYSSVKNKDPYAKLLYRASGVYLESLLQGTHFDPETDVLRVASGQDDKVITFDPSLTESSNDYLTGFGEERFFFPGVLAESDEDPEPVKTMLAWATAHSENNAPETAGTEKSYLTLVVGQLNVKERVNQTYGKYATYVIAGDDLDEVVLTVGSKTYTRKDILMMDFAEAEYTYTSKETTKTDLVRGVPFSVLLAGEDGSSTVEFEAADEYDMSSAARTVQELIDGNYMLAYEVNGSGVYEQAKPDAPNPDGYGFLTMYGDGAKPMKMINKITVTTESGIDFSKSPYKHITNGGESGEGPYNIDSITGATLTVEGPGVKSSVPVTISDLEGRNAGAVRADYTDVRDKSDITRTYEGIDLYFILHNMTSGENGIKLTDLAQKVQIKNRNRRTIAEFTLDQVEEAHNSATPIIVAYGTSLTNGTNIRPFVFNGAAGADPALGNEDGCIKLVYNKDSITGDTNTGYTTFGNMAYIYVAEAEAPGYKHDKEPYKSAEISNYVLTVTGDKIGREVNYTVSKLENMVEYDSEGKPDNSGMGYRDEYSLANSSYWYVNEYEGIQLWKLLLQSGLDAALADDDETLVSSTATDGYTATDKFTIKQVADPDSFGYYEKNPADPNDGTYEGNENIRQGDDVSTGDKLRTGYPVLVAYGVNGYPYVEKDNQAGYLSGLENDGGPLRIISGKLKYGHANGSNQAKYLDKVVVGDNTNHYSTHKYHSDSAYTALGENEITVTVLNGSADDAPVISEKTYKIGDIEELIYGGKLSKNQLAEAKIKTFYQLSKNGNLYSDLYEGINLNYFLQNVVELPGTKGTIMFNGDADNKLNLEDVLAVDNGSNTETGMTGLAPLLAYGKNGAPMVESSSSDGYQNKITLAEGTEYENQITVKNDGGPLAVLFPHTDSSVSEKSFKNVTSITINLSPDKYSHTAAPYDSYADETLTIKGEGTRLDAPMDITLGELEAKQTIAFTGDYSILKSDSAEASQTRYRGINLYKLLSSTAVGLRSNADKVIITTTDEESKEFSLSDIRKTYMNSVTGETGLPVLLAYGTGKAGEADKEDGKPLVAEKTDVGYDAAYGNNGGPVRLVVGQTEAGDVNSGKNMKFVKTIEVTASEMTSWNHNSADIFKQYRDEKVQLLVTDRDGAELFNKTYTVGEIEDNTALVERIDAYTETTETWEGINLWRWVKQEAGSVEGLADPVSVTEFSADGQSRPLLTSVNLDGLEKGILDGGKYIPVILAYGKEGYPLVIGDKAHTSYGEGYDATAGNNGGPLRLIVHNNKGISLTYITKIVVVVGEGGSVEPETPADFTIQGLKSGDITMSVDDIRNLKNSAGDNVGQATGEYVRKGVTKKVKGALLKNILAANGVENENTIITLNTPDAFETSGKGASYNNITLKQAIEQDYMLAYQEWDETAGEWKDIEDIVKDTDIHTNLRMYRYYCAANGLDNQSEWLDECSNINAITLNVPDATVFKEYPTSGGVRSTWMDKDGTIWAGTYGGGLYYKKAGESEFSVMNTSSDPALKTNFTSAVAADADGGIWVSQNASYTDPSGNQGVLYIKGNEVKQYLAGTDPATIPNNYVQAIKVGDDGKVWFGSFGGVTIYDPSADSWVTYSKADKTEFPATSVCTITLDESGAWLGFYPDGSGTEESPYAGGFCHITADGTVSNVVNAGGTGTAQFAQSWVRSIVIDKKGTLWAVAAGTNIDDNVGGVIWKLKAGNTEPDRYTGKQVLGDYLDGSNITEVRVVAVDNEGSLWFGTSADGVLKVSNPKLIDGKMTVDAQYAKETGSWSAANMNNVYSIDFWNDGTAYVGTSGGVLVLGDEPESDEPEPAGDATAETADVTFTGDALTRDAYFSIRGIKNTEGIEAKDATFHTVNSSGTAETLAVQGATLENILDYIGIRERCEITSIDIYASDSQGVVRTYSAEEAFNKDLDGNKAMFIWKEGDNKVQKVVRGQLTEGEANKGKWVKNANKLVVNGRELTAAEVTAKEIDALPKNVTTGDKAAIEKARADYNALTEEEQASLPEGTLEKLEAAEAKLVAEEIKETSEAVKGLAGTMIECAPLGNSKAKYTASTYAAFEQAYTAAQAVMSKPDATKAEIDAANEALINAKDALKLKKTNTMKVSVTTKTLRVRALRKSKRVVKAITVRKPAGTVSYKRVRGSKRLLLNTKTGKITVRKGTKKGTYKLRVKVTAAGGDNYKPLTKYVTVKIRVR